MRVGQSLATVVTFVLLFYAIRPAYAVEVIQREKPAPVATGGIMSPLKNVVDFLGAWWLPILIIACVAFVLIWLFKWLQTKKEKENIFLRDYNRTLVLCHMGMNPKRIRPRAFWLYILVVSIFASVLLFVIATVLDDVSSFQLAIWIFIAGLVLSLVMKFSGFFAQHDIVQIIGGFGVKVVGYYLGECVTSDGYKNYLLWNARKYFFWKNKFILKVNMNDTVRIETVDEKTRKRTVVEHKIPKDLILEGDSVIAIKGEGVDKAGYFYYPLITDEKGNIVNMDLIAYARAKDVAMLDTLYQQTEDFSKVQRQAINMNPNVRYIMRTKGDTISGAEEGG
jgi:hypothetical protein